MPTINITATCGYCGGLTDGVAYSVNVFSSRNAVQQWCERCHDRYAVECENCHEDTDGTETVRVNGNNEEWCGRCIDEDHSLSYCEQCEEYTDENMYSVEGNTRSGGEEQWCESCRDDGTTFCDCCERYITDDRISGDYEVYTDGEWVEMTVCDECYDELRCCERCGRLYSEDYECGDNWTCLCPDCGVVQEWGHTDGEWFWGDDLKEDCYPNWSTLYIGVELETSDNDDIYELARNIDSTYGNWKYVCKKDSSLGPQGLEIVSQPMTPLYHLNSGEWERIVDYVHEQGGVSYDSGKCGLHMHVSREFLDEDAPYRIDRFFHRFREEMINFSRRNSFEYCHLDEDTLAEIEDVDERKYEWECKKSNEGRYVAVNLENDATVELRLWRGSLNMETIRATIEMTAGLAYVANAVSDEFADELDWNRLKLLVRYALEEHGIPHDDFDSYIERRGL